MFTWSATASNDARVFSDMYMDNDILATILAHAAGGTGNQAASNTVITHCASGSRIYIQCGPTYMCQPRGNYDALQTFAGFLLSEDDEED